MKSKDEIERTKAILEMLRLTMPPILFVVLTVVLTAAFGLPFWVAALIGLVLAAAEYIAFSLILNRWAGL